MFDAIRNNQRILLLLLVLLIFPAFAFFGISGYDRFFAGDDAVAVVEDSAISVGEFNEVRRAQIENMRRILGDQFDPAMLDTATARNEILDSLIQQRVLALHANQSRIAVPDEALRAEILRVPQFQDEQGNFDPERYRTLVAAQGQSEQGFEARLRSQIALQLIPTVIGESEIVPEIVARRIAARELEQRRYRLMRFDPVDFIENAEVDVAAARAYYDENPAQFRSPEAVRVETLVLSQERLAGSIEVTEAEINEYYENNRVRYVQEAQRKASHILVAVGEDAPKAEVDAAREKALSLRERVTGGESFAEVATAESDDPGSASQGGDLGWFDRDTMTAPFAEAAFSLDKGAVSEPVRTEFGFHLIEVTDARGEQQRPLAEVHDEVEAAIRNQKARQRFLELAEVFSNTVYEQPDTLAATADRIGLPVKIVDRLQRNGQGLDPADAAVLANPRVLRAVFDPRAIEEKLNIEAVDVGDNTLVSARVLAHMPSELRPFEDVEAQALAAVRAKEAARLARAAGENALEGLRQGNPPQGRSFGEAVTTTRGAAAMLADAAKALFNAPATDLPSFLGSDLGDRGYLVAELMEVLPAADERVGEATSSFADEQAAMAGNAASDAYLSLVADGMQIERHDERIAAAVPGN